MVVWKERRVEEEAERASVWVCFGWYIIFVCWCVFAKVGECLYDRDKHLKGVHSHFLIYIYIRIEFYFVFKRVHIKNNDSSLHTGTNSFEKCKTTHCKLFKNAMNHKFNRF